MPPGVWVREKRLVEQPFCFIELAGGLTHDAQQAMHVGQQFCSPSNCSHNVAANSSLPWSAAARAASSELATGMPVTRLP